ncbi:MAG: hypothetical protein KDB61_10555 [Planctomycetes bacterium]|nr:hypothetical protein [Planctomycetota bacterium]
MVYQLLRRDPYASVGIDLEHIARRPAHGGPPTERQLKTIQSAGLPAKLIENFSSSQVEDLREYLLDRKAVGLCTPRQAKQLLAIGGGPRHVYRDEALELLREAKAKR